MIYNFSLQGSKAETIPKAIKSKLPRLPKIEKKEDFEITIRVRDKQRYMNAVPKLINY